jgi:hypothetical protein
MQLSYVVDLGKVQLVHVGFAAHKVIGIGKPMERAGLLRDSAEQAIKDAEALGPGHAAFRIMETEEGETGPSEQVNRADLPVHLKSRVGAAPLTPREKLAELQKNARLREQDLFHRHSRKD